MKIRPIIPFYWSMRPGAKNDGYWKLAHFVVQLENFMDVCDVLYPNIQHIVSVDHSNNHGGKRIGGLDLITMNTGFGGAQVAFDRTVLTEPSCLGIYDKVFAEQLDAGDIQYYTFDFFDGPFWMTSEEREASKLDVDNTGIDIDRKLKKAELVEAILQSPTPPAGDLFKKSAQSLRTIAERLNIPTRVKERKIREGWAGKPKGLLQICWERRLIPADTVKGRYKKNI